MPVLKMTIPGEVKGLARPRASTFNGHARMYDPVSNLNEKGRLQVFLRDYLYKEGLSGHTKANPMGYSLEATAFFRCPKSMSKRTTEAALNDSMRVTKKPDCDNILKLIADAWNGLLWEDDAQLTEMRISKRYGETDRLEVTVSWTEVGNGN